MPEMKILKGIGVSGGIGAGKTFVYNPEAPDRSGVKRESEKEKESYSEQEKTGYSEQNKASCSEQEKARNSEQEKVRYSEAVQAYVEESYANAENIKSAAGEKAADILRSHGALASDPDAVKSAQEYIDRGLSAEESAQKLWGEWKSILLSSDDPHMRERSADADDVLRGILSKLRGEREKPIPPGCVLVCREFTPYLASKSRLAAAVISEKGGITSHGAILARSMGIPCIMGVKTENTANGEFALCDGDAGEVVFSPDAETKKKYEETLEKRKKQAEMTASFSNAVAKSASGRIISVECNAGSLSDVAEAVKNGCDGVGLFRTEFLFCERACAPDEEEQFSVYSQAAQILAGRPLTIRILDAGGDKKIPYLDFPREDNPFLGVRGIRLCKKETGLLKTQLRAILRASAFGNVRILVPMVTQPEEMYEVRRLLAECREELTRQGIAVEEKIPVGAMVETPAAAICADLLSGASDFFSVGTNDLTQYIMAADRGNSAVSEYYNPCAAPVIRALEMAAGSAQTAKISCHVCGEAAADENFLRRLLETGIDGVSVAPSSVGLVKYRIINS